jgi:hypothetical protein
LAVAHVIKRILDSPSFTPTKQILEGLPRTEFVAETYNGHLVVQFEGHYWVLACSETPFGRRCLTRAIDYRPSSLSPPWTK